MTLYLVFGGTLIVFCVLLGYIIRLAMKQGETKAELEDNKIEIETQKKYIEIASRPQSSPNVILKRMRTDKKNK